MKIKMRNGFVCVSEEQAFFLTFLNSLDLQHIHQIINNNWILSLHTKKMADSEQQQQSHSQKTPSDFLQKVIGKPVLVKLNSGVDYKGMAIFIVGSLGTDYRYILYTPFLFIPDYDII